MTIFDHDTGDEDRSDTRDYVCPFCGDSLEWRRRWVTPLWEHAHVCFADMLAAPLSAAAFRVEELQHCRGVSCMAAARRLRELSREPLDRREDRRKIARWQERYP